MYFSMNLVLILRLVGIAKRANQKQNKSKLYDIDRLIATRVGDNQPTVVAAAGIKVVRTLFNEKRAPRYNNNNRKLIYEMCFRRKKYKNI